MENKKRGPKVSVIVPVYNTEKFLTECLESCERQTLPEVEFICVNDGSTDGYQDIIDRFSSQDKRFVSIIQENRGVSSARNNGLKNASDRFIMFLDSDDILAQNACETVWNEYLANYPDIIVFKTNILTTETNNIPPWLKWTLTTISRKLYSEFSAHVLFGEPAAKPFIGRIAF